MTVATITNARAHGLLQASLARFGVNQLGAFASPLQLSNEHGPILVMDATAAAKILLLPAIDETNKGMMFILISIGTTNAITVKDTTNATTFGTLAAGKAAMVFADQTGVWRYAGFA